MMASDPSLLRGSFVISSVRSSLPRLISRRPLQTRWAALLLVLVCLISQVMAATADASEPIETLLIDTRIPVQVDGRWSLLTQEEMDLRRVKKRAPARDGDGDVTTTFSIAVATKTQSTKTSSSTVPASPLPSPLDGSLSANFTGENGQRKCPAFINTFLSDPIFKQCYPFSLLLQGSKSFFNAQKSLVSITQVLDASCKANSTFCTDYLTNLATNLTSPDNCGDDYNLGNSVVVKTYLAMLAYSPVYTATCLKDAETSMYCFANAVTNRTNPTTTYFYFLPLNKTLPGSSVPACNRCLQQTMNVFHTATADRKQQIANTYASAAEQVNTFCGPNFANESLADPISSSASPRNMPGGRLWLLGALSLLPFIPLLI